MKKKFVLFTVVLGIMVSAAACGKKDCKAEGCSEEVYKKGFCEEHYLEHALEEGLKELGGLFD